MSIRNLPAQLLINLKCKMNPKQNIGTEKLLVSFPVDIVENTTPKFVLGIAKDVFQK